MDFVNSAFPSFSSFSDLFCSILEGIATVVIAIASFWMLYDYPDTAKFLNSAEKRYVVRRLKTDNDGLSHEYKKQFIKDAFVSPVNTNTPFVLTRSV